MNYYITALFILTFLFVSYQIHSLQTQILLLEKINSSKAVTANPPLLIPHDNLFFKTPDLITNPPASLIIEGENGPLVTLYPNGDIEYGKDYHPDATAQIFWQALKPPCQ